MKICIITPGFGEPTLPFAEHLVEKGHNCDLYILSLQGRQECGTLNFDYPIKGNRIYPLSKQNSIYHYLNDSIDIFNVPYHIVKYRKYIIGFIPYIINFFIFLKTVISIKKKRYSRYFVVVHEETDALFCRILKLLGIKNVSIIYHEVLSSHSEPKMLSKPVKQTLGLGYQILTYSNHNNQMLSNLAPHQNVKTLYFGPFETYKLYDVASPILQEPYILFIGSIQPYKGLPFLYETIIEKENRLNCKVVVAGSGSDSVLSKMKADDRFIVINRFLNDSEFANLTKHSICVVCPYKDGSQSGITHTAMALNVPIIATRVAAFEEFVEDGRNGLLVDYGNKQQLADAISFCISRYSQQRIISIPKHLQWDSIVTEYEKIVYHE